MKVSTEKIPDSQILMTIEVEQERLDEARKKALRKLSPRAKVPGFRPGKAPANLVQQYFGDERILDEALDDLVPDIYREAVEADESIDPVARPRLVIETTDPLVVKATIPVRPTVELNDYTAVRVPIEEVTVDEARVDATLLTPRRRGATVWPAERGIQWRDVTLMHVEGAVGDESLIEPQEAEVQFTEERDVLFPGFEEAVLGTAKGEEVEFDIDVPEAITDERFAGKQVHFKVQIIEVKEEVLPELDEEFTKAIGEGFDSVEALRDRIRADIQKHEEEQRDNRYHDAILNDLTERATLEFPPVMLEVEIDRLLHDQAGHIEKAEDMERYLASIGRTAEQLREELTPIADVRLRRSLVLSKAAEAENIEVTDDDITSEIETMSAAAGPQAPQFRQMFDSPNGRDTIRRNLLTRKTLQRLVDIATGGTPQDGGAAADADTKKKPAKKRAAKSEATDTPAEATVAPAEASAEEASGEVESEGTKE